MKLEAPNNTGEQIRYTHPLFVPGSGRIASTMMSCSQSDDDEELGDLIYKSSCTAQRIRASVSAEEKRASFGIDGVQNPPPVFSLREEESDPESNTRNSNVGQSHFEQRKGKKRMISLLVQENYNHSRPAQK